MTSVAAGRTGTAPRRAATMRAAVLAEPGKVEMMEAPLPEPGPGEVRVRVEGCGVCASNLPPWEGRDWFDYPFPPGKLGHEAWGVIDQVGTAVKALEVGDRVAFMGNQGYAAYDVVEETMVVPLPDALEGMPFPGEPLGCAVNIFKRSDVHAGQTVAILGVGFLGALLIQMCKAAGARTIAISRRPHSLEVAKLMGADETVAMDDHWKVIERVAALTGGVGGYGEVKGWCERVIECTGKEWPLQLAGELCAVRGRLVIAGFHQDGMRSVPLQLWNWRGLDVINAHERDPAAYIEGVREAVQLVQENRLDPSPLYTHTYPLERLGEALQATHDRPDGFMKALVQVS